MKESRILRIANASRSPLVVIEYKLGLVLRFMHVLILGARLYATLFTLQFVAFPEKEEENPNTDCYDNRCNANGCNGGWAQILIHIYLTVNVCRSTMRDYLINATNIVRYSYVSEIFHIQFVFSEA